MGSTSALFVLLICLAFGIFIFLPNSNSSVTIAKLYNATNDVRSTSLNSSDQSVAVGNPLFHDIFSSISGLKDLLVTISGSVGEIFSFDLPPILRLLFISVVAILFLMAVIGLLRGTNPG